MKRSETETVGIFVRFRNARLFFRSYISTLPSYGQYRNWYRYVRPACGSSHSTMKANFSFMS